MTFETPPEPAEPTPTPALVGVLWWRALVGVVLMYLAFAISSAIGAATLGGWWWTLPLGALFIGFAISAKYLFILRVKLRVKPDNASKQRAASLAVGVVVLGVPAIALTLLTILVGVIAGSANNARNAGYEEGFKTGITMTAASVEATELSEEDQAACDVARGNIRESFSDLAAPASIIVDQAVDNFVDTLCAASYKYCDDIALGAPDDIDDITWLEDCYDATRSRITGRDQ